MVDLDKLLYQAKLSNSSNRHTKTFSLIETIIRNKNEDLTAEERNLLAISYKHIISASRASLTKINEIYEEEKQKGDEGLKLIVKLKATLEDELKDGCLKMIDLLDKYLIKNASSPDSKVFFYKLKGDYYRYLSIFFISNDYSQNALMAYKQATQYADMLSFINPIKIDLALSFSVFYYDILKKPEEAISIASETLNEGLEQLEKIEEADMKEATTSLQMLKDNIDNWSKDLKQDEIDDI